jgi:hypothetical protein
VALPSRNYHSAHCPFIDTPNENVRLPCTLQSISTNSAHPGLLTRLGLRVSPSLPHRVRQPLPQTRLSLVLVIQFPGVMVIWQTPRRLRPLLVPAGLVLPVQ